MKRGEGGAKRRMRGCAGAGIEVTNLRRERPWRGDFANLPRGAAPALLATFSRPRSAVRGKACASAEQMACFQHRGATPPDRRQPAMAPRRYAQHDVRPRAMAGASLALRPFRVTALGRRGYWRLRRFAAETGRSAVSVSKTSWLQKGHRGGRGSRFAKRSGATGEAGLALRRARLDGAALFGICVLERARF